jgi:hypothetical protein
VQKNVETVTADSERRPGVHLRDAVAHTTTRPNPLLRPCETGRRSRRLASLPPRLHASGGRATSGLGGSSGRTRRRRTPPTELPRSWPCGGPMLHLLENMDLALVKPVALPFAAE